MNDQSKNQFSISLLFISLFFLIHAATGQTASKLDSLNKEVSKLSKSLQAFERIKISGYIQAQYQHADTLGARTFNGGDFPKTSSQRFMVRRGYFKLAYQGTNASYVLQFNVNEKGFSVRDAYFILKDPWIKTLSLTGGIFYRPFGCELPFPTHLRETPELARVTQTLFPGERDLGASLTFRLPDEKKLHPLKIEAGLFAGNGTSAETDDKLDFIGRIAWEDGMKKNDLSYQLGASIYNGSVYQSKKQVYKMNIINNVDVYQQLLSDTTPGKYQERKYFGLDASFGITHFLGTSRIRGDYMWGMQPGSDTSSMSPTDKIATAIYNRSFQGYVIYFIHSFPHSIHSVVIKYDYYDPNTDIAGHSIGKSVSGGKATGSADLAYATWGFGYFADVNRNLRLTAYYDLVINEKSNSLAKYERDLKDNIFTIRVQYKF
jgi:hypothetical protein